jgi:hypothetical protein
MFDSSGTLRLAGLVRTAAMKPAAAPRPPRRWRSRICSAVLVAALAAAAGGTPAPAGEPAALILRTKVRADGREGASEITHYWTATRLVEDMPKARVIADFPARTITVADKVARTYRTWSFDEFRRVGAESAAKLAAARTRSADPDARRRMQPMVRAMIALGDVGPDGPQWRAQRTGREERVAGQPADVYDVAAGDVVGSIAVARELRMPFGAAELAALRAATAGTPRFGLNPLDRVAGIDGVLLRSRVTASEADGMTVSMDVVEVGTTPPPPEMLQVPAGFTPAGRPGA